MNSTWDSSFSTAEPSLLPSLVMYGGMFGISLIISIVVCLLMNKNLERIPARHRQMEPSMVWLLLIPCFNIVWNFFVFIKTAASFKSYFDEQGIQDVGDCGHGMGLGYSIAVCCGCIPCVGCLAGPVSLVLLVLALVKFNDLKNRIPEVAQTENIQ